MFEKILVAFVTSTHSGHTSDVAFELAKKFNSKITFLKCLEKEPPEYGFFESKGQKEDHHEDIGEAKHSLKKLEERASKLNIPVDSKIESTESISNFLEYYVKFNHFDLLIIDSQSLDEVHLEDHKEMINGIYTNLSCAILTLV
jgi:nucleotide-binding universal stress UspA family protein